MISSSLRSPAWYSPRIFGMSVVGLQSPNSAALDRSCGTGSGSMPEIVTVGISSLFSPVTTTVPPLPMALNPASTTSAVHEVDGEDGRVGALPPGHVCDGGLRLLGRGERVGGAEFHRLLALVSPAGRWRSTFFAPAYARALHRVDADAADAVDRSRCRRARRSAAFTAEPHPVGTPQPTSTALSSGRSSSTLTTEVWWIVPYWLKVPDHAHRAVAGRGARCIGNRSPGR